MVLNKLQLGEEGGREGERTREKELTDAGKCSIYFKAAVKVDRGDDEFENNEKLRTERGLDALTEPCLLL